MQQRDLTDTHNKQVNELIEYFRRSNLLNVKTANMLKTDEPKTLFYNLPTIHKENSPGRSVISSKNCHTAKLSLFVDYHLQEHVTYC